MRALAAVGAGVLAAGMARARLRNWGATREKIDAAHPGDDLVAGPVTTTTYAVTVQAPAETVWSWLVAAALMEPVILLMTRRMLVGIKSRAEHDVREPQAEPDSAVGMPR